MVDRYQEDFTRAQGIHSSISKLFKERQQASENKQPTGKFDYRIKSSMESLKQEIGGLEKLKYLYEENDAKYASIAT